MKSSTGSKRNKYIQTGYGPESKPKKVDVIVPMRYGVHLPRVPHFVQTTQGSWIPLCALSKEGLEELGRQWTEVMLERATEQAKNAEHFFKQASTRHNRAAVEHAEAAEEINPASQPGGQPGAAK